MQSAVPKCRQIEDNSFQQYEKTMKKFNREVYQWPMNSNPNVSDQNLHRRFFSTSDLKQSQVAQKFCQNSKGVISQEAIRTSEQKYSHENFVFWNDQFQQFIHFVKSEGHCSVSLKTLPLFSNCKKKFPNCSSIWDYLILWNLDTLKGTRKYNKFVKLTNERQKHKKMVEEKDSLESRLY